MQVGSLSRFVARHIDCVEGMSASHGGPDPAHRFSGRISAGETKKLTKACNAVWRGIDALMLFFDRCALKARESMDRLQPFQPLGWIGEWSEAKRERWAGCDMGVGMLICDCDVCESVEQRRSRFVEPCWIWVSGRGSIGTFATILLTNDSPLHHLCNAAVYRVLGERNQINMAYLTALTLQRGPEARSADDLAQARALRDLFERSRERTLVSCRRMAKLVEFLLPRRVFQTGGVMLRQLLPVAQFLARELLMRGQRWKDCERPFGLIMCSFW